MADKAFDPDDELNNDLARTTGDLIEGSKQLLAELDRELRRRRPSLGDDHRQRRSA